MVSGGAQPVPRLELTPAILAEDPGEGRHALVEEGGLDPLQPGGALLGEVHVQPHHSARLLDVLGRDPGLREGAGGEELAEMPGVDAVGLRVHLPPPPGAGLRGLGEVGLDPGAMQLLDHEAPAGAALQRERRRPGDDVLREPGADRLPVGRHDPSPADLAGLRLDEVEGELSTVHVEPAYDGHGDLLTLLNLLSARHRGA